MTEPIEQIRSLLLAVIVVTSVTVVFVGVNGSALAASNQRGDATSNWTTNNQSGDVGSGATIHWGEDITDFSTSADGITAISSLSELVSTGQNGGALENPVPEVTGQYTEDGSTSSSQFNLTVVEPRIQTLDVRNNQGEDVADGTLFDDQDQAYVYARYNYYKAENLELTVEDGDGIDVTDEIVTGAYTTNPVNARDDSDANPGIGVGPVFSGAESLAGDTSRVNSSAVVFSFDPSEVGVGDYTFTVEPNGDISGDDASASTTVSIAKAVDPKVEVASNRVAVGDSLDYTVSNVPDGDYVVVTIANVSISGQNSEFNASETFQRVGDYVEVGVATDSGTLVQPLMAADRASGGSIVPRENAAPGTIGAGQTHAYALLESDGGEAVSRIDTEYLSQDDIELNVHAVDIVNQTDADTNGNLSFTTTNILGDNITDTAEFAVTPVLPGVPKYNGTLENDGTTYTVGFPGPVDGNLIDVFPNGTDGIDAVYRFNSQTDSWEQQTDFSYTPDDLTAIAIVTSGDGPSEIDITVEFEQQSLGVPGERDLETGWNLIAPSSYDTPGTVFDRGTSDQSLILDSFAGPQIIGTQSVSTFQTQVGSSVYDVSSGNPPMLMPFKGYFVYVTDSGAQPAVLTNLDTRTDADSALNATGN